MKPFVIMTLFNIKLFFLVFPDIPVIRKVQMTKTALEMQGACNIFLATSMALGITMSGCSSPFIRNLIKTEDTNDFGFPFIFHFKS